MVGGLLGVGGGILFVPALAIFLDEPRSRAEATSLLAIVPVALVAVWRQRGYGNVRLRDGLVIGALSPLGVAIGVVVANEVCQRALELVFAGLALVIATQLVFRALRPAREPGLEALLERALDARVEGVQPIEGERLGDGEAAAARGPRPPSAPWWESTQWRSAARRSGGRPPAAPPTISAPSARWPSSRPSSVIPNSAP